MHILKACDYHSPPWKCRPATVRGVLASIMQPLTPTEFIEFAAIHGANGRATSLASIRGMVTSLTPPGRRYSICTMEGGIIRIWRHQ